MLGHQLPTLSTLFLPDLIAPCDIVCSGPDDEGDGSKEESTRQTATSSCSTWDVNVARRLDFFDFCGVPVAMTL